jgi:acetylornithine deacetylase/succinyl-diaminopimelate desuccinylase-like protein
MKIDWNLMEKEAVERLRSMIRFDTTNPPGNELPLVRQLAEELEREGLEPQVLESVEGRGNLAVRLKGDGSERPLLLLSHLDVVPVEPERWTHPPFAGEVADGFVWGRGAIDSKLTGAVELQVLLMCRRLGLPLKRDLVVVAAGDEEFGGKYGVGWLVEEHPELFDAEFGINEAGGFGLLVDGKPLYVCQVGEKGSAPVDLVAKGRPGHSSVPHDDNPIPLLGKGLVALGERQMPHRVTESARAFFEGAAAVQSDPKVAADLRGMLNPEMQAEALARLPVNEATRLMFDAMVRNTCAPTVLESGLKRNVIPSEATAQLSGRPLPGVTEEEFLREVREIVGEGTELRLEEFRPGVEFDHRTALFDAIAAGIGKYDPEGAVVPYMQTGGTDARFLTGMDMAIYGFIPMRYEPGLDFFDLCHGHDERVSLANVCLGVQVLFDVVCRLNGVGD